MGYSEKWINILNEVAEFQKNKEYTWFRGQSDIKFNLLSGLYRIQAFDLPVYLASERYYYTVFKRMGHLLHREAGWNLLFLMQHHGVRTRLLDWTEAFATSLYFATSGWNPNSNDCVIWMLDPIGLNELSLGERVFYLPDRDYADYLNGKVNFSENSLAVYPLRNSNRINSQLGMFTMQGNNKVSLEEEFNGTLVDKGLLGKVIITKDMLPDINMYLKHSGVSHYSVYPDLDGLAKFVNDSGFVSPRKKKDDSEA
ncbi:FRG domain-containing protein [Bacillales bacterium AN1005]